MVGQIVLEQIRRNMKTETFQLPKKEVTVGIVKGLHLPLVEAYRSLEDFNKQEGTGLRIIHPALADRLLRSDRCMFFFDAGAFLTDGMVAYPPPNESLPETTEFRSGGMSVRMRSVASVPGTAAMAIGLTSAHFVEDKSSLLINARNDNVLMLVDRFPQTTAWYRTDENEPWIPGGTYMSPQRRRHSTHPPHETTWSDIAPNVKFLVRQDGAYVGPIVRAVAPFCRIPMIYMDFDWSLQYSMVVEIPTKDVPKFTPQQRP